MYFLVKILKLLLEGLNSTGLLNLWESGRLLNTADDVRVYV